MSLNLGQIQSSHLCTLTGKFEVLGKMSKQISGENFLTYIYGKFGSNVKTNFRETTCVPQ